ncbi:MAG TPA: tetratricopeptide repeat protein [Armatimonadaceae bacterium]|nr:tetratricopeptide repeat protein [Armatimonadaceae bacterium]
MAEGDAAQRFQKAIEHKLVGEYDQAIGLLESILAEQPTNAEVFHELGLIHSFRAYMDESFAALEQAVRLSPTSVPYILSLGKTYAMFGEDDKARRAFQYVLQQDPFNDEAQKQLSFLG